MPISHLVFDLDDTLYPPGNGLWEEIGARINRFMIERVGIDPRQVNEVRQQYYLTHGTTLRGLMTDYATLDPDEYLTYVHEVDLNRYIAANPALDRMLATLPQPKTIFTNSDAAHAGRVLNCLGIAHHFPTIVDIRAMNFANKPHAQAYDILLKTIATPPGACLLIEDSARNLRPAKALGMTTVWVGHAPALDPAIDYQATNILETGSLIWKLLNS